MPVRVWNNKGFSLANLGKHLEAILAYDEAIKFDPRNSQAWNERDLLWRI